MASQSKHRTGKKGIVSNIFLNYRISFYPRNMVNRPNTFAVVQSSHVAAEDNRSALEPTGPLPTMWLFSHLISSLV